LMRARRDLKLRPRLFTGRADGSVDNPSLSFMSLERIERIAYLPLQRTVLRKITIRPIFHRVSGTCEQGGNDCNGT